MKTKSSARHKKGFTLTEMLVTISIIVILCAVAIPSVILIRGKLEMHELNSVARTLYITAQNRLTAIQASGELPALLQEKNSDGTSKVSTIDTDFYIASGGAAQEVLFPVGTIEGEVAGNNFIAKFDKNGGMLAAYYWKNDEQSVSDVLGYDENSRNKNKIGYYNGNGLNRDNLSETPALSMKIENGEELTAILTAEKALPEGAELNLTISSAAATDAAVTLVVPGTSFALNAVGKYTYSAVLDSLENDKHFSQIFKNKIPAGDNLRLSAMLTSPNSLCTPSQASATANSLFASRATVDGKDTVYIANGRHLQNLCTAVSGVSSENLYAEQFDDINWATTQDTYKSSDSNAPALAFTPITAAQLKSYNGNQYEIRNLTSSNGLFAKFTGESLSGVRLVNPKIKGNDSPVGALAGSVTGRQVTDCQVYLEKPETGTFDPSEYTISSTADMVGGLIGQADNCSVFSSFAALPISGGTSGGLIGSVQNVTISQCYANTYLSGDGKYGLTGTSYRGALVGSGSATITNCFALSNTATGTYLTDSCSYSITQIHTASPVVKINNTQKNFANLTSLVSPDSSWTVSNVITNAYTSEGSYPYPVLKFNDSTIPFYGDWPVADTAAKFMFGYYEKYTNGEIGYFAYDDQNKLQQHLKSDMIVVDDGYALFAPTDNIKNGWINGNGNTNKFTKTELTVGRYTLCFPNFSNIVKIEGKKFAFDSRFAKEVSPINSPKDEYVHQDGSAYAIRSARQLYNLTQPRVSLSAKYSQELDIDYTKYTGHGELSNKLNAPDFTQTPIGSFTGTYDGGCHYIQGVSIQGSGKVGLFSSVSVNASSPSAQVGQLKNIVFRSVTSGSQNVVGNGGNDSYTGALAGTNEGLIENCAVAGFEVSAQKGTAGGLVGYSEGSIVNSSAACASVSGRIVGGFLGNAGHKAYDNLLKWLIDFLDRVFETNNRGSIQSCYSVSAVLNGANMTCGFIGNTIRMNEVQVSNCYAACSFDQNASNKFGFATKLSNLSNNRYKQCYYLKAYGLITEASLGVVPLGQSRSYDELITLCSNSAKLSVPYTSAGEYPFNAVVKNAADEYIHYGDWPVDTRNHLGFFYYSKNSDGTYTVTSMEIPVQPKANDRHVDFVNITPIITTFTVPAGTFKKDDGFGLAMSDKETNWDNQLVTKEIKLKFDCDDDLDDLKDKVFNGKKEIKLSEFLKPSSFLLSGGVNYYVFSDSWKWTPENKIELKITAGDKSFSLPDGYTGDKDFDNWEITFAFHPHDANDSKPSHWKIKLDDDDTSKRKYYYKWENDAWVQYKNKE